MRADNIKSVCVQMGVYQYSECNSWEVKKNDGDVVDWKAPGLTAI